MDRFLDILWKLNRPTEPLEPTDRLVAPMSRMTTIFQELKQGGLRYHGIRLWGYWRMNLEDKDQVFIYVSVKFEMPAYPSQGAIKEATKMVSKGACSDVKKIRKSGF